MGESFLPPNQLLNQAQILIDGGTAHAADAGKLTGVEMSPPISRIVAIKDRRDVGGGRLRPSDPLVLGVGHARAYYGRLL